MKISELTTGSLFKLDGDIYQLMTLTHNFSAIKHPIGIGDMAIRCKQKDPMFHDLRFFPNLVWIGCDTIVEPLSEYRLVAYIFPENPWGNLLNEGDKPILARDIEAGSKHYGLALKKVGPMRGKPRGLMVYMDDPYIPEGTTIEDFVAFKEMLQDAISKPVLHRDDFTEIFEV